MFYECVVHPGSDPFRLQLTTGKMPFSEYTDHNVIIMVSRGKRPPTPDSFGAPGMTPAVWKIAKKCWNEKAKERLETSVVLQSLENIPKTGGCTHQLCSCSPWELIDKR